MDEGHAPLRVLMVEDCEDDAILVLRELSQAGYELSTERVDTERSMESALRRQPWDVVITDYSMPSFDAIGAISLLRRIEMDIPCIIVSGTIGEETAVNAMKAGAHDYIMKRSLRRLVPAIQRELREAAGRREQRLAEETIRYLAYYDSLTDLPNRTLLQDRLLQAILVARREHSALALIVMDLDRFKDVNDTFGHQAGDLLLQQVGERLQNALRASDTVARLGGDEFAIVLPNTDAAGAIRATEKVLKGFEPPFAIENRNFEMGVSIGVAMFPEHGEDVENLLRRADIAMYHAKGSGGGAFFYSSEHDDTSPGRLALVSELHRAIDQDQLVLYYQPKVRCDRTALPCVEALARWEHPEHGLIMPDGFIPLAEQTGLIKPLTNWVLNAALQQCSIWREQGLEVQVAVNISMRNLHDPMLPAIIGELLAKWRTSARYLSLELTESTIMANPARAVEIVSKLREMGVQISIDDFGTGYSSLAYLKRMAVDELKVDKSFVMEMAKDENDAALVRAMIDLAHNLGLKVVAEGVEDDDAWEMLAALNCDAAQGFYLGRAVPAAEYVEWWNESPWGRACPPLATPAAVSVAAV